MTTPEAPNLQPVSEQEIEERSNMNAMLFRVKDEYGTDDAKQIISEYGKVARMNEIKPENFEAVFKACQLKLNPPKDEPHVLDQPAAQGGVTNTSGVAADEMPVVLHETKPGLSQPDLKKAIDAIDALDLVSENKVSVEAALHAVWNAWN